MTCSGENRKDPTENTEKCECLDGYYDNISASYDCFSKFLFKFYFKHF